MIEQLRRSCQDALLIGGACERSATYIFSLIPVANLFLEYTIFWKHLIFLSLSRADYKTANDNEWDKSEDEEFKETDEH